MDVSVTWIFLTFSGKFLSYVKKKKKPVRFRLTSVFVNFHTIQYNTKKRVFRLLMSRENFSEAALQNYYSRRPPVRTGINTCARTAVHPTDGGVCTRAHIMLMGTTRFAHRIFSQLKIKLAMDLMRYLVR